MSVVRIRKISEDDIWLLFNWVNDHEVRKWSFQHSRPITESEHKQWFYSKLVDQNVRQWVMEEDDRPCGQVRFERIDSRIVLHYSIAAEFRGRKLAVKMLNLTVEETLKEWLGLAIYAYTFTENYASRKSLLKAGFRENSIQERSICFVYDRGPTAPYADKVLV